MTLIKYYSLNMKSKIKIILFTIILVFFFLDPLFLFWKHVLLFFWEYVILLFLLLCLWLFAIKDSRNFKLFFNRNSIVLFKKVKIQNYTKKLDSKKIQSFHNYIKEDNHLQRLIFEILNNHFKSNQDILNKKDDILSILELLNIANVEYYFSSKSRIELNEKFIDFVDKHLILNLKLNIFTLDLKLKNSLSKEYIDNFFQDVIHGKITLKVSSPYQITSLFENFNLRDLFFDKDNKKNSVPILFKCLFSNNCLDLIEYLPKRFLNEKVLTYSELLFIENSSIEKSEFNLFECLRYFFGYFDYETDARLNPKGTNKNLKLSDENLDDIIIFKSPFSNLDFRFSNKELFITRKHLYNIFRLMFSINYEEIRGYKLSRLSSFQGNLLVEKDFFELIGYYSLNFAIKRNNYNYSEILLSNFFCQYMFQILCKLDDSNLLETSNIDYSKNYIYPHEYFEEVKNWSKPENVNSGINDLRREINRKRDEISRKVDRGKGIFEKKYWRNPSRYINYLYENPHDEKLINYIAKNYSSFYNYELILQNFRHNSVIHVSIGLISSKVDSKFQEDILDSFLFEIINYAPKSYIYFNIEFKIKYAEQAVLRDEENFKLLPDSLKNDSLFFRKILKQKGYLYSYLSSEMKTDKSLIISLIQDNYEVIDYLENYSEFRDLIIIEVFNNIQLLNSNRVKKEFEDINLLNDLIVKTNEFEFIFNFIPKYLLDDNFYLNIINNSDVNIFDNNIKFEILERKDFIVKIIQIKGLKYLRKFSYKISNDILEEIYFEYLITQFFGIKSLESIIHFNSKENFKRVRVFEICFTNLLEKNNINFILTSILNEKQSFIKFQDVLNSDFYILEIKDEIISMKREVLNQNKVNLILFREKFDFENNLETEIKIAQNIFFRVLSIDTIELNKYVLNLENGIISIDLQFLKF